MLTPQGFYHEDSAPKIDFNVEIRLCDVTTFEFKSGSALRVYVSLDGSATGTRNFRYQPNSDCGDYYVPTMSITSIEFGGATILPSDADFPSWITTFQNPWYFAFNPPGDV